MEARSRVAIEVEDLDDSGCSSRIRGRAPGPGGAGGKLQMAYEWCILHPATAESGTATWGDAGLPGL